MATESTKDIRICWFGIYRPEYPRNYILLNGLAEIGATVVECRVESTERFKYCKLIWKFLRMQEQFDVLYVAFPAQSVVPIARFLTLKPVVMDAFYSMYDSVVYDREAYGRLNPRALWLGLLDWVSFLLASKLITDTAQHAEYFASWPLVSRRKCQVVPIGSDTRYFYPIETAGNEGRFLVQYHGSYIPLQGLPIIIEAAKLLQDDMDIHVRCIGSGQEFNKITTLAKEYELRNVEFIERVPFTDMNRYLNEADIILGIFGDTKKTMRVVPNKVYEGLAVKKPVITLDTPAVRETLSVGAVALISRDAAALAAEIIELKQNTAKRATLAANGYDAFTSHFCQSAIAQRLYTALTKQ